MKTITSGAGFTRAIATLSIGMAALSATSFVVAAETIKIGAPLALTGGLADEGHKQEAAYQVWLEKVNAAGGIAVGKEPKRKAELVYYDYQTDAKRAQQ